MTSTKEASFRYRYDEIESLPFWVDADANINDCIDPDPTGASFAVDYQHDLIYEKLHTLDAELGQLYQSLGKVGSGLSKYDAGFFWLRLPEPNNEEASRLRKDQFSFGTYRLPHKVIHAVRVCQAENALMISCITIGDAAEYASNTEGAPLPRIFHLRSEKSLLHELLVRLMLASVGVDSSSLPTASQSKVFDGYDRMLSTAETQMPLPEVGLPSKRMTLSGSGIPNFFDVAWPTDEPILQSGGFFGFFHDFYHMTVKRPYQKAPTFEFIRILINPKGVTSRRSMPKCLIVCSSVTTHDLLYHALISIRIKQGRAVSLLPNWTPLHELMNCISAVYQVMFQEIQSFVTQRFSLLQDMKFHGRVHPWRSKIQYLRHLEDQIEKSLNHLETTIAELENWRNAKVSGVRLVSIHGARWAVRIRRLRRDASHLTNLLKDLDDRRIPLHSMLKEQLDLNSGTRSLILTVLASIYVPLAFVSSYFGMNAKELTDGGLVSTTTFWEVSIPVMVASIIIPIVFSGLLIRLSIKALRSGYKIWLPHGDSIGCGILLALSVASAVRGGLALFWTVWTANLLYILGLLPSLRRLVYCFQKFNIRATWRSGSREGIRTPATGVSAAAFQASRNPSELDVVVPITDSEQADNVQMTATAAPSQVSVHSSVDTASAIGESPSLDIILAADAAISLLISLGGFALGSAFLVLDILYHPKTRPSLSFYHSFALWFSLLGRIEYLNDTFGRSRFGFLLHYVWREQLKGPQSRWHRLGTRLRRDKRSEGNETRSKDGSRAESNRASAV